MVKLHEENETGKMRSINDSRMSRKYNVKD